MKKNQQGFALAISLTLMIILTFLGFNIASRGKVTSQIIKTSVRYEAVAAAAEAEMYRLMNALVKTENIIKKGNKTVLSLRGTPLSDAQNNTGIAADEITMVWDNEMLATQFGTTGMPVFYDFRFGTPSLKGWEAGIISTIPSQGGNEVQSAIRTRSFVQELVSRQVSSEVANTEVEVQYLFTVKAYYVQEPHNLASAKDDIEKETIVIQSVFKRRFIL